ncbi:uncharacterized protein LOC143862588 isoform X2 [Tasmannia lanceolata]|uniref:uncharacterized protein LOC143862588 isoform X2 n=1 Tax=Tasmannia lanceolata TaxID=3420 RepID=UPI0040646C09
MIALKVIIMFASFEVFNLFVLQKKPLARLLFILISESRIFILHPILLTSLPSILLLYGVLSRSAVADGSLVAFGGSDGVIRVLSMLVRRYTGDHKGSISCLMTFMASSGEGK